MVKSGESVGKVGCDADVKVLLALEVGRDLERRHVIEQLDAALVHATSVWQEAEAVLPQLDSNGLGIAEALGDLPRDSDVGVGSLIGGAVGQQQLKVVVGLGDRKVVRLGRLVLLLGRLAVGRLGLEPVGAGVERLRRAEAVADQHLAGLRRRRRGGLDQRARAFADQIGLDDARWHVEDLQLIRDRGASAERARRRRNDAQLLVGVRVRKVLRFALQVRVGNRSDFEQKLSIVKMDDDDDEIK
jgi:hypothetical protein